MQTITESEENSYSDLTRSITINKNLNKLDLTDLTLRSHTKNTNGSNHLLPNISPKDSGRMPKIIRDLNLEYNSSEPFNLRLIVQGENLNIEWYHDDEKIVPLVNQIEFIQLDSFHTYELVFNFSDPTPFDSGFYYCRIINKHGSVLSSTTLVTINETEDELNKIDESIFMSKPIFIEYFFDVCVDKESQAVFKCKIVGKPDPIINWYFGATRIDNNQKYELLKDSSNHYLLIIREVDTHDQGEYTCNASNCKGETSWSANLYFNKTTASKSKELSRLANTYLDKLGNDEVNLNLDNIMNEDYYSKMKQLENKSIKDLIKNLTACNEKIDHLETNLNDGEALKLQRYSDDETSIFEDVDSDSYDEATKAIVRNMPKILQDLRADQLVYKTYEPFSITLVAQGDSLIVEWFHDDEKVIPLINQIEFIKMDQPKTYELVYNFNSPMVSDSGSYYCSISNKYGSLLSAKVSIKIIDPDIDDHFSREVSLTPRQDEDERNKSKRRVRFSLPRDSDVFLIPFHKTPIPLPPGQPVISEYKRTSLLLSWAPSRSDLNFYDEDDRDLDSQSNLSYLIEYNTSVSKVWAVFASNIDRCNTYVDNLNVGLVYSFRVRAENQIGISDVSPIVSTESLKDDIITRKPTSEPHIIHSRFRRAFISFDLDQPIAKDDQKDIRYFVNGQTAEASMLVFGYPVPEIKWMRNKKMIVADEKKYKMHSDRLSYYHLEVVNATEQDDGLYQIVATTDDDKIFVHDIYLHMADPPVFLETFEDTKIKSYQDVFLTCRIDGIPTPEIKFYKDKFRLVESNRIKIKFTKPDTWTIHIKKAFVSDTGLYTCAVKNIAGESVCSGNLVIEQEMIMPYTEPNTMYSYNRARAESVDYIIKDEEKKKVELIRKSSMNPNLKMEMQEEDFDLAEGAFLLPVIDTSLMIRIREYQREASVTNDTIDTNINNGKKWGSFAIKERIEVDSNGNLNRAGSLSRELERPKEIKPRVKHSESAERSLNTILEVIAPDPKPLEAPKPLPEPPAVTPILPPTPPIKKKEPLKQPIFSNSLNKNHIKDSIAALKASLNKSTESVNNNLKNETKDQKEDPPPTIEQANQVDKNKVSLQVDKPSGLFIKISENEPPKPFLTEDQVKEQHKLKLKQNTLPQQQNQLDKKTPGKLDLSIVEPKPNEEIKKEPIKLQKRISNSKFDSEEDEPTCWTYYNLNLNNSERLAPIIREKLKDAIMIIGTTLTLECKIEGNPTPRIFWYHDNQIIHGNDGRIKFTQTTDGKLVCTISNANKSDLGNYRCTAMNKFGITVATAKVISAKLPDRPTKPIVYQYSDVNALVTWQKPSYNNNPGNSNILGYKVDYKKSDEFRWSTALYTTEERCLIAHLIPQTKYRFRASCINSFGLSQFSWASEECETLAFGHSNITIQSDLFEKLLNNRWDLIKSNQQWILVKKPIEECKSIIVKKFEETKKSDQLSNQVRRSPVKPVITQPILHKIEESSETEAAKKIVQKSAKIEAAKKIVEEPSKTEINEKEPVKQIPSFKYAVEIVQKKIREEKIENKNENENKQKGQKSNAFEKFKQAYLAQQQQKPPAEPKTKYLQLY